MVSFPSKLFIAQWWTKVRLGKQKRTFLGDSKLGQNERIWATVRLGKKNILGVLFWLLAAQPYLLKGRFNFNSKIF